MKLLMLIGAGGFLGSILRYLLSQFIQDKSLSSFPYGTFGVNFAGCLAIGLVIALSERAAISPEVRMFLATGFCGGFTTFSAFSAETFLLLRDGQIWYAGLYVTASLVLGIIATLTGYSIAKIL